MVVFSFEMLYWAGVIESFSSGNEFFRRPLLNCIRCSLLENRSSAVDCVRSVLLVRLVRVLHGKSLAKERVGP